ncbi:hypothetical protein FRC00_014470, partial [Tulasnella sp. 408]
METSQVELAVNRPQGPPASEAEPSSNTGNLPTVRVDGTAAQGVATHEEGGTSQGSQETLAPNESEDSLVQPGVHVRERELPSELAGALTNIREPVGPVKKKNTNRTDGGAYADIYEGELEQPDGSNIVVAIKCIRGVQGNIEAVNK